MKVIAINGSPRKKWNTATLLNKALEGAAAGGAETRMIHLYDLTYKGCVSCFACKRIGGNSQGRCAMEDGLTPILDEIHEADALILGSPIYFFGESGEMRTFMERLCFPYLRYTNPPSTFFPKRIRSGLILTMNITSDMVASYGFDKRMEISRGFLERVLGHCEMLLSTDTLQFDDYLKYESARFDPEAKARRRKEVFPTDMQHAHDLGRRLLEPLPA